ncbi:MAG: M48 family metallopeptidase [Promethearchaeati archaeon]
MPSTTVHASYEQATPNTTWEQDHDNAGIGDYLVHSNTVDITGVGPVLFERSRKAKRVVISVKPFAGVRVAVPYRSSFQKAKEFACTKVDWMQRQLARMKQYEEGDDGDSKSALDSIDRAEARRRLIRRLEYLATQHGFTYDRVFIRSQKTRLGTCSNRNNIGLNIKVSCLPEELMDYVILHELAHTRVKNHGKEFWTLMDELVGDGKAKAAKVREYSIRHLLGSP